MKYEIIIEKAVIKFLEFHKDIVDRFFEKIDIMETNPKSILLDIKRLQWSENKYRLRIWKYRFLFRKENNQIIIYFYDSDSRWDIYK